jgi:hypothetical protein
LAIRVAALEEKVGNKTMQEQLCEQAELIDRRILREGMKIILAKLS